MADHDDGSNVNHGGEDEESTMMINYASSPSAILPSEILFHIVGYASGEFRSLLQLSRTCHFLHNLIILESHLYRALMHEVQWRQMLSREVEQRLQAEIEKNGGQVFQYSKLKSQYRYNAHSFLHICFKTQYEEIFHYLNRKDPQFRNLMDYISNETLLRLFEHFGRPELILDRYRGHYCGSKKKREEKKKQQDRSTSDDNDDESGADNDNDCDASKPSTYLYQLVSITDDGSEDNNVDNNNDDDDKDNGAVPISRLEQTFGTRFTLSPLMHHRKINIGVLSGNVITGALLPWLQPLCNRVHYFTISKTEYVSVVFQTVSEFQNANADIIYCPYLSKRYLDSMVFQKRNGGSNQPFLVLGEVVADNALNDIPMFAQYTIPERTMTIVHEMTRRVNKNAWSSSKFGGGDNGSDNENDHNDGNDDRHLRINDKTTINSPEEFLRENSIPIATLIALMHSHIVRPSLLLPPLVENPQPKKKKPKSLFSTYCSIN